MMTRFGVTSHEFSSNSWPRLLPKWVASYLDEITVVEAKSPCNLKTEVSFEN
jgi:hypothetical protein